MVGKFSLSLRVYDFVAEHSRVSLQDVYRGLGENPRRVSDNIRRLWRRGFLLRTRDPEYVFGTKSKGRAGIVGFTRAVYYYALNNGQELPSSFIRYED